MKLSLDVSLARSSRISERWLSHYRIDGPAFIYVDRDTGRTSTILGYRRIN
jgi:hypothetical protein